MPKPDPASQRGQAAANATAAPRLSRLDDWKRQKIEPPMPPNPAPHITGWLTEIGLVEAGAGGAIPLSWSEIYAWQCDVHVRLAPWEARLIRSLSAAYVTESRLAESENCPPPWRAEVTQRVIDTEQARLEAVLG